MATFNPNRVLPGTIELVRDSDGNYTSRVVGLESINSLSLPEISTTAAVTKTDTDAKTATDITGDTLQKQTQMAFKTGDDNQPDTTGDMLQEAKKTSGMLANVSTPTTIQDSMIRSNRFDADTFDDKVGSRIEDPTEKVFGKSTVEDVQKERQTFLPEAKVETPQEKLQKVSLKLSEAEKAKRNPETLSNFFSSIAEIVKGDRFKGGDGSITRAAKEADFASGTLGIKSDPSKTMAMKQDELASGTLGITADPTQSATRAAKEADFASGILGSRTVADSDIEADDGTKTRADIKPEAKKTFAQSVNTALKGVGELVQAFSPISGMVKELGRPVGESAGAVSFNKTYFTDRGDGRIGGNPAEDLYAGMNRVSKFGNLEKAGDKRIATREKTIARKGIKSATNPNGVSQEFVDRTNTMKDQANDYKQKKKEAPVTGTTKPGESGGSEATGGGKIVCTMMNESYGFGSFRNKIWMKFHGNIAPEYQKGYHKLFLPLVNYAKQKGITNKIIKNILEHIAVHSTIDMRQTLRGKRHTLGRLYRKIILPLCYWAGKK